ncbi:MAG: spermidine synthase [Burkholderiales bacterium]|nr:spermidine synthase [Burkholderiales bacterium]
MSASLRRLGRRLLRRPPAITVSEAGGVRSLHVGGEAIQSAMCIDDPFALALDYTRCMMAFLLFHPRPRDVLMIGLGGGSLAKFVHRRMKRSRVRAIESDARVVQAARRHFALPPDDARLAIEVGDGAQALAPQSCDVLMVDGFEDEAQAPGLASRDFYDAAYLALRAPGVLVVNFMSDDPALDRRLRSLERAFGGAVLALPALSDPNVVVLALRGTPARMSWARLHARAARLERRFGLPFPRYVGALKRMNLHTDEMLLIEPPAR